MSDQAKLKEQLKKTIRALVISSPLGLTPKEVEQDFAQFEGRPLPYRKLGYSTCQDFLQAVPDTLQCLWERGHLVVRAVTDEKTRHIEDLVSKQKVNVQKCLKRRHTINRNTRPVSVAVAKSLNIRVSSGQSNGTLFSSKPRPHGPPTVQPSVPAYVRNQIRSFLIAHPNGVLNSHFNMLFMEKFGHTISFTKLGFTSLRHLCHTLSEFVSLELLNGEEFRIYERSNHPGGEVKSRGLLPIPTTNQNNKKQHHVSKEEPKPLLQQVIDGRPRAMSPNNQPVRQPQQSVHHVSFEQSKNRQDEAKDNGSTAASASPVSEDSMHSKTSDNITSDRFETKFLEEIREVLADHPEGLWAAYLPDVYKKKFKKPLQMMSLGYYSVTELMTDIPEVVAIEREQKHGDWKLYDVRVYKPTQPDKKPAPTSAVHHSTPYKDLSQGFIELKKKIRTLLEQHPQGILLKSLAHVYQRTYFEVFPLEELDFRDIDSLIMMMPDTVSVVYKGYGRLVLFLVEESNKIPRSMSIPNDAVGWGFSYSYPYCPSLHEYVEIYVATVYTPHRLCIQLRDKKSNRQLDDLMDNLESVYAYPEGNQYEFPESMLAVGQVCCVLYISDNNWHRGLITGIPRLDFVEVLYVDYGTVATVSRSALRLLKSCFMTLPIQSFNARLAYIEPVEERWTSVSRDRLLALTAGKPLIAVIRDIQKDELCLEIIDTSTSEDVHIIDALVVEGLARLDDTQLNGSNTLDQTRDEDENSESGDLPELDLDLLTLKDIATEEAQDEKKMDDAEGSYDGRDGRAQDGRGDEAIEVDVTLLAEDVEPLRPGTSRDTVKQNSMPQLEEVEEKDEDQWIVKRIDLEDGYSVHLINHQMEACLTVAEVTALLCDDDDSDPEDVLCQLTDISLGLHKPMNKPDSNSLVYVSELDVDTPLFTAMEHEHPKLFQQLRKFELIDSCEGAPEFVTLMPFTSALLLLSSSGTVSMGTVAQLQQIAEDVGILGDMCLSDVNEDVLKKLDLTLELEELNMTLETLHFKRKRILNAMLNDTDMKYVDELSHIENRIHEISFRIRATEGAVKENGVEVGGSNQSRASVSSSEENGPTLTSPISPRNAKSSPGRLIQTVDPLPRNDQESLVKQDPPWDEGNAPAVAPTSGHSQTNRPPSVERFNNNMNPTAMPTPSQFGAYPRPGPYFNSHFPILRAYANPSLQWMGPTAAPFMPQQAAALNMFQPAHHPFAVNPQSYFSNLGGGMAGQAPRPQGPWW